VAPTVLTFLSFLRSASLFQQSATLSYAHKPPKTVAPTVLMQAAQNCGPYSFDARVKIFTEINCSHQ